MEILCSHSFSGADANNSHLSKKLFQMNHAFKDKTLNIKAASIIFYFVTANKIYIMYFFNVGAIRIMIK